MTETPLIEKVSAENPKLANFLTEIAEARLRGESPDEFSEKAEYLVGDNEDIDISTELIVAASFGMSWRKEAGVLTNDE